MNCILFTAKNNVHIEVVRAYWDGIIEYSYDNLHWQQWYGEEIVNNVIYMRGVNNTIINAKLPWHHYNYPWIISGKNIKCQGNIENLLDYKSVINNVHPKMAKRCFAYLFYNCWNLIEAPQLPSNGITNECFYKMFGSCTSLSNTPCFSNLQTAKEAIVNQHMFEKCPISFININNKLYDINVLKLL